jgi:hypothetical protein
MVNRFELEVEKEYGHLTITTITPQNNREQHIIDKGCINENIIDLII